MRKAILLVVLVCVAMISLTTSCNKKKVEPADSTKTVVADTTDTTNNVDSATKIIAETPMPKAADQLFDDFFFNFIANKSYSANALCFHCPLKQWESNETNSSQPMENGLFLPSKRLLYTDFR